MIITMALSSFLQKPILLTFLLLSSSFTVIPTVVGCIERERQALLQFKHDLVDDYGILSSWRENTTSDCCQYWRGVRCSNHTGQVVGLHLHADKFHSLRGDQISPSLAELEGLSHLDLSFNDFEGIPIPPLFASLTKIQYLNLSQANFAGPLHGQLRNLSNLLSLDLSLNDMYSENLEWISHLSSLKHLDLSGIDLSKAIHWSQAINKLPSLVHLNLGGCRLPPLLSTSTTTTTPISSLSPTVNSSNAPLAFLDLSENDLTSSVYPWLLNFNATLVHLNLHLNADLNGSILGAFASMISLTYLDISANQLEGSIPEAFGNMSSLTYLDLSLNQLQGLIPKAFGNMSSLTYLDLSFNQLQGSIPNAFGNMSSLLFLDFSSNQLHGSIPDRIGNLTSLERLFLYENKLEGEIPKSLSKLCCLKMLALQSNKLNGQLPLDLLACANNTLETLSLSDNRLRGPVPHLTGFSSLRDLYLDYNQLNGTLPTSIGHLTKLQRMNLSSNSLQGTISEAHLLRLSQLLYLDLSSNSLTFNISSEWVPPFQLASIALTSCKLGPHFPTWLHTQKRLTDFDISNSEISDAIPDWFWINFTSHIYTFNISNNHFIGALPDLSSKFVSALYIDMSSNHLGGSIPRLPSDLAWLDLSNNKFSGPISVLCTSSMLYLVYLDLSNNLLSGDLPNCHPQWKSLTILNLENNKFSGKVPKSFGSLQSIQSLHLRNNCLVGELPSSLKKCKSLSIIDLAKNRLSGKIPPWIGGSFTNLTVLNLRFNSFSGSICSELCQLKKIQILDLSSNNMQGIIPRCLSNFSAMTKKGALTIAYKYDFLHNSIVSTGPWSYVDKELIKWKGREFEYKNTLGLVKSIDLSSNNLVGEIPKEVTDLLELVSLNLSRNNLTESIPSTIGELKSLEILDLSHNQLIGEIPTSLSRIDRLSTLDLSNNSLSGKIPQGTQLQSFNASTYEGNPKLCGLPLLRECPRDEAEEVPNAYNHEDNIEQDGNNIWFYVSIVLGFIVGFWGVCGTLLLNNSWRYAYFRFLNKIKDWIYVATAINMARLRRSLQN